MRRGLDRGRRVVGIDLKRAEGVATVLRMVERADALVEAYRPGVAERLGLGPDECRARNPRLVYGRLTGWGQDGPLAHRAGHDLNYVSLTGVVHAIGPADRPPTPPLQILGDFAGGGLVLAFGVACALVEAARSGQGQVVDAAMVDGVDVVPRALLRDGGERRLGAGAARTCSTAGRRSTPCTPRPTGASCRWAPSSRSSGRSSSRVSGWRVTPSWPGPASGTGRRGRRCGPAWRRCSPPQPAPSGATASPAPTPA